MPAKYNFQPAAAVEAPVAAPAVTAGPRYNFQSTTPPSTTDAENTGASDWLLPAAGVAAGAGLYALTRNPGMARKGIDALNDLRRMSMLSGMAPIKSFLGNVGGTAYEAIREGSMAPLKELFSPETAKEALATFKAGPSYSNAGPATGISKLNVPGRIMGSLDTAAQGALKRSGHTPEKAAEAMLQSPVPALRFLEKNPVADYLVPFRRTPWNQFEQGFNTMKPSELGTLGRKAALGTAIGSGIVEGATIDDPKTQSLATAAAGRYGLPTAMAAGMTKAVRTGSKTKGAQVISGMSPISDYSLSQGALGPVVDPLGSVIPKPALIGLVDYLKSLF